ncbi:MAG: hypothetical protein ACRCVT_09290 [Leadbetterella sp.]
MFWIYDIPIWLFFIVCNGAFIAISLVIFVLVQRFFIPILKSTEDSNDLLNYFVAALGAFYSITLGLIAVGTWENYKSSTQLANDEAASIAALYRDVTFLPKTVSLDLQSKLKEYTRYVIEEAWPLQQKGIVPAGGTTRISDFQKVLYNFEPQTKREEYIFSESINQFNRLILLRRNRLADVQDGLPSTLWLVIFSGAFLLMFLFSLFVDANIKLQKVLVTSLGVILGTSVFLISAMDYPYRGEFSVTPEAFSIVYKGLMGGK